MYLRHCDFVIRAWCFEMLSSELTCCSTCKCLFGRCDAVSENFEFRPGDDQHRNARNANVVVCRALNRKTVSQVISKHFNASFVSCGREMTFVCQDTNDF